MLIAGVDATARGALFGDDIAAAVILKYTSESFLKDAGVRDSKLTKSEEERAHLAQLIKLHSVSWAIGISDVREINRNADQAEYLAMNRAVMQLRPLPKQVLVDGKFCIPGLRIEQIPIPQGDRKEIAIAAASILAKHCHDLLIEKWDKQYPGYGLARNKAHASAEHRRAIATLGLTKLHRRCAEKFANRQLVLSF